jgi:hypothetical protein
MVALVNPFNALQYDPEMGASALPLGLKQPVRAMDSSLKGARENNNNGFVEFTVEILDGPNKGQTGAIRFNLYNQNGDAARIAHNQLAAMATVCGNPQFQDTAQLHNIPFLIDVTAQKVKAGQEDKGYTEVTGYYTVSGQKPLRGGQLSAAPQGGGAQQTQQSNFAANQPNNNQQQAPANNGGNAGWNTGGGNQTQDQTQQQQQFNQNQQQQQVDPNQQQQQFNNQGQNQQQQQAPANNANAGWQSQPNGGGQAVNNNGGGAPWNK